MIVTVDASSSDNKIFGIAGISEQRILFAEVVSANGASNAEAMATAKAFKLCRPGDTVATDNLSVTKRLTPPRGVKLVWSKRCSTLDGAIADAVARFTARA